MIESTDMKGLPICYCIFSFVGGMEVSGVDKVIGTRSTITFENTGRCDYINIEEVIRRHVIHMDDKFMVMVTYFVA